MDGDSSGVGSSMDKVETKIMDHDNVTTGGTTNDTPPNRISSTGADDESENDELTIDDSCVPHEEMDEDNDDNNIAIVSSSIHHMNEEDNEEGGGGGGGDSALEPEAVAVPSKPLEEEEEDEPMGEIQNDSNSTSAMDTEIEMSGSATVSTTTSESIVRNTETANVSAEMIQEEQSQTPSSPPTTPPPAEVTKPEDEVEMSGAEDNTSQDKRNTSIASPEGPESPSQDGINSGRIESPKREDVEDTPQSPEHTSTQVESKNSPSRSGLSQTESIVSQENFSQLNNTLMSLDPITSQSSVDGVVPTTNTASQDSKSSSGNNNNETSMDGDDTMDNSQLESSSQGGTQNSPSASEMENEESQQSSVVSPSGKSAVSNGSATKSRSKSRSRSNTKDEEEDGDVDLEDGEIMDDDEEEVKATAPPPPPSKEKKEKEKSSSSSKSSSSKDRSSEKEKDRSSREKDKEKDRDKDKHRKDKKHSKRHEEKEKEKDKDKESSRKNKKRKASDAVESEQEEFLFVRGASPGSAVAPPSAADPWSAPVEEFGDDSKVSRAKRRRESDGDVSPAPHHHHSRPPREPSPPVPPRRNVEPRGKRPAREERKEPKSDVICAYFMQGKCQKSAMDCTFSHDAVPPRKMELCKFWMMECCAKKEKCLYLHNDFPCKYYHTGLICKAGDRCKFSHSPLSDVTKQVLLKHIETAPKEILGDFPRLNRQGAINLINKMEARLRGEKFEDDKDGFLEMNQMEHHGGRGPIPPPHERHHGHGHNRNEDRHNRSGGRDHHGGGGHGHGHGHGPPHHGHGPPPHHGHGNPRMNNNNDVRGGNMGRGGGGPDDRHHNNNNNNRSSRWEQQQPTRDDQEKLHELMQEAGISGFYKDTLETGMQQPPVTQAGPPGGFPGMQPPLLPLNPVLMSQMLPGLLPQSQANSVNNPALANVLASLNIPSTTIVPPTTTLSTALPQLSTPPTLPSITSQASEDSNLSNDGKTIPEHLPKMQQELFMRIQKQQQKNEKKMKKDKSEPDEQEENWYSSEDEDDSKKKDDSSKTEISDKISSVLNQIRQQSQPQANKAAAPTLPPLPLPPLGDTKPPAFYGDTDFRSQATSFKDVDLRNPASIFKKIDIEPAKEINASLTHNGPMVYRVRRVAGVKKIDYSTVRMGLPPSSIVLDPRLGPKRNNSIPAPASPTETSAPDVGIQPLNIPDGSGPPIFDPRTMRGSAGGSSASSSGRVPPTITPQQNNPFLDSDNRFASLPNPGLMNDGFAPFFNRDPRGGGGGDPRSGGASGSNQAGAGTQAQMAAMAAAMAAMQQQLPNMQGGAGIDPNLLMLGFPFLPQNAGGGGGNGGGGGGPNPMDFQQMLAGGGAGNMRMRPPFTPQQPASSSWERLNQGPQGQGGGDLTPPL